MRPVFRDRLKGIEGEMEAIFRDFFVSHSSPFAMLGRHAWQPPTDVYETDQSVIVRMEIPGVNRKALEVTLTGDILQVRGFRTDPAAGKKLYITQMEIHYGPFEGRVRLPRAIDQDQATAHYHDGFLEVNLPKSATQVTVERRSQIQIS